MTGTILAQSSLARFESKPWVVAVAGTAALWTLNAVWLAIDTRPPVWDMALHQFFALRYVPGFLIPNGLTVWQFSGNYPPLVHIFMAVLFSVGRPTPDVAAFVNLPATFLLLWATFELGRCFASAEDARWTCVLTLLTPYLIWMSRETILDYWLTAWVATAWMVLIKTDGFDSRRESRRFGIVCGLGLLTKWLFAGFMLVPFLWIVVRHRIWRSTARIRSVAEALLLTTLVAGTWYIPNLSRLFLYFGENAKIGAAEGEPPVISFQSLIYYVRLLEGYQLYAFLFLMAAAGIAVVFRKHLLRDPFLWAATVGGGWLVVTLLRTKDPRFSMPLLPVLLLAPGAMIASLGGTRFSRIAKWLLVVILGVQAYVTNFGVSWLPQQIILMRGYQGSLRWDWQLYSQHYFGILGPPRRENWRQNEIIARVATEARSRGARPSLTLVPDLPRFDTSNFLLFATREKISMAFGHAGSVRDLEGFDFVITTDRDQGMSWTTAAALSLNETVRNNPAVFKPIAIYDLPIYDTARLSHSYRAATVS